MASKMTSIEKEFIFTQAMHDKIPVRIHGSKRCASLVIVKNEREQIILESRDEPLKGFSSWDKVSGYIPFRGQTVSFKAKVKKVDGQFVHIAVPESLYKSLNRKFVRVDIPSGMKVSFFLQGGEFSLAFPVCEEYSAVEDPGIVDRFDASNLQTLVDTFREKAMELASTGRIVMFKQRKPETIEEELISRLGKVLYIPSTKSGLPANDPYPEKRLITKALAEDFEGPDAFVSGSRISRSIQAKGIAGVHSEIYAPILFYQYVTGYVYLCNSGDRTVSFNPAAVEMAYDFSRILAYFLKTHNYFNDMKKDPDAVPYKSEIIDVSVSGLLMAVKEDSMSLLLKHNTIIDLELEFAEKKIRVPARIMRRSEGSGAVYYGLAFQGMMVDEVSALYRFLYHKDYGEEATREDESSFGAT